MPIYHSINFGLVLVGAVKSLSFDGVREGMFCNYFITQHFYEHPCIKKNFETAYLSVIFGLLTTGSLCDVDTILSIFVRI